jgi:hypothetical protein
MDKNTNRSMPPGTIIVELVYEDVATAATWLCQTFGFRERLRIGQHRSQLVLGEAAIVVMAPAVAKPRQRRLTSQNSPTLSWYVWRMWISITSGSNSRLRVLSVSQPPIPMASASTR